MDNNLFKQKKIDEEYQIWDTNSPYLYEFVIKHNLEWPSLMVDWIPDGSPNSDVSGFKEANKLLLGTHTTDERNYLIIASAKFPGDEIIDVNEVPRKKQKIFNKCSSYSTNKHDVGNIYVLAKIPHRGEVHRACPMPQNPNIVASRGPNPEIYLWNFDSKSLLLAENKKNILPVTPIGLCSGHTNDGYGLCWNPHKAGCLLSGSHDANVCFWDVNSIVNSSYRTSNQPLCKFSDHTSAVEDVGWNFINSNVFGSVADDRTIRIWDLRENNLPAHCIENAHTDDIHAISFHHNIEFTFATGSADRSVSLWDLRNLKRQTQILVGHTDQVYSVAWSPFRDSILASCSNDRRVALWDLSLVGNQQTEEDAQDGPPELLFLHGGHTSKVLDFSWNYNRENEWTIASVAEDNSLQVWMISADVV